MPLPTAPELLDAAKQLTVVARKGEDLRRELRWETARDESDRIKRIFDAMTAITRAMAPVRSAINRFAGGWAQAPAGVEDALREASQYAQYQRKQLKKMLP